MALIKNEIPILEFDSGFYTIFDEFPNRRNIPKRLAFSAEKRCAVDT